ncbi:uncharacterized protein LOC114164778 [Vigna unguiculata]|uniref:uncharacterized protein LOC114164778 n=1 Tax=Vigna unguiculata TaxID=3917 RepID=UPI00101692E2|nr:uncharacterized protein LOC114164778 [Vigna unguiculata]
MGVENEHIGPFTFTPIQDGNDLFITNSIEKKSKKKTTSFPNTYIRYHVLLCPFTPPSNMNTTHQTHSLHESGGDREFSFWGSPNTTPYSDWDQPQGNEARFYKEADFGETHQRKNLKFEYSPFCSTASNPSRSKAIAQGQMELMEMVQDMPESGYELSFQDMVVHEKHVLEPEQPHQNETSLNNTHMQSSGNKDQLKKLKKKKKIKGNSRPGQILRVESMDSETFLLKLFFPISLDWMKKDKMKNESKVSSRPSFQESIKQVGKDWRIKGFSLSGNNTEDGMSDTNRYVDHSSSFSNGCWSFLPCAKGKTKNMRG